MRTTFHNIPVVVSSSKQTVIIDAFTKNEHDKVIGVCLHTSANVTFSQIKLDIDEIEVFPKGTPAFPFSTAIGKSLDETLHKVNLNANSSKIEGEFTDGGGNTYPYTVNILLKVTANG